MSAGPESIALEGSLWDRPQTWVPLVRILHGHLVPGRQSTRVVWHDDRFDIVEDAALTVLGAALRDLEGIESLSGRTAVLTVDRAEAWEAVVLPPGDQDDRVVVLVPGAVPEPCRAPEPPTAPPASNDLDLLRGELRRCAPEAVGATSEQLAEAERILGRPLPPQLRALFETVADGWVDLVDVDEVDDVEIGSFLVALPDRWTTDWVQGAPGTARGLDGAALWSCLASDVPKVSPDGAVAPKAVSPGWIPFAHDGGGNPFCLDLTPGPTGRVGQVVQLEHDQMENHLVADSLTDFVRGIPTRHAFGGDGVRREAYLPGRDNLRPEQLARATELQALRVSTNAPIDLGPCLGLPKLWSLTAARGSLVDVRQVLAFPALEYLELSPADWRVLLDAGAVPRTLLAAGITPESDTRDVVTEEMRGVAARLRAAHGVPAPPRTVLTGRL